MDNKKIIWAIEEQLRREQEELDDADDIVRKTSPIFDALEKRDIINEVRLMLKLRGLDDEYRLAVYYLFRIAIEMGPDGSFIILDREKALALSSAKQKKRIKEMTGSRLKIFCEIINTVNARELTRPLSEIVINLGAKALGAGKSVNRNHG